MTAARIVFLMLAAVSVASCQTGKGGAGRQTIAAPDGFFRFGSKEPVKIAAAPRPITPAGKTPVLPPAAPTAAGFLRGFGNSSLNSRVPFALNAGLKWKVRWQRARTSTSRPAWVLRSGNRVVVEAEGLWTLYEDDGREVAQAPLGPGAVFLDDANFYAVDSTGLLRARRLADGIDAFALSFIYGEGWQRRFVDRRGARIVAVGIEIDPDSETGEFLTNSIIESVDIGTPPKTDRDGLLTSAAGVANLTRPTGVMLAASRDDALVVVTENRVYNLNRDLEVTGALTGEFTPRALSLDEAGRIYMIVEKRERRFLWAILPDGKLAFEFELPANLKDAAAPPIVGYDHRVYVVSPRAVAAVGNDGRKLWSSDLDEIGGAVVTANGVLVVAAGSELIAFDTDGRKSVIFKSENQRLTTPPVLTESGDIFVAGRAALFRLTPQ